MQNAHTCNKKEGSIMNEHNVFFYN